MSEINQLVVNKEKEQYFYWFQLETNISAFLFLNLLSVEYLQLNTKSDLVEIHSENKCWPQCVALFYWSPLP